MFKMRVYIISIVDWSGFRRIVFRGSALHIVKEKHRNQNKDAGFTKTKGGLSLVQLKYTDDCCKNTFKMIVKLCVKISIVYQKFDYFEMILSERYVTFHLRQKYLLRIQRRVASSVTFIDRRYKTSSCVRHGSVMQV